MQSLFKERDSRTHKVCVWPQSTPARLECCGRHTKSLAQCTVPSRYKGLAHVAELMSLSVPFLSILQIIAHLSVTYGL